MWLAFFFLNNDFCVYSCPTLCDPLYCSPPSSSVHVVFRARILKQVAISFSRVSSQPRDQTLISCVSCIAGLFFTFIDSLFISWLRNLTLTQSSWRYPPRFSSGKKKTFIFCLFVLYCFVSCTKLVVNLEFIFVSMVWGLKFYCFSI